MCAWRPASSDGSRVRGFLPPRFQSGGGLRRHSLCGSDARVASRAAAIALAEIVAWGPDLDARDRSSRAASAARGVRRASARRAAVAMVRELNGGDERSWSFENSLTVVPYRGRGLWGRAAAGAWYCQFLPSCREGAPVAELADALDGESGDQKVVWVRIPPGARHHSHWRAWSAVLLDPRDPASLTSNTDSPRAVPSRKKPGGSPPGLAFLRRFAASGRRAPAVRAARRPASRESSCETPVHPRSGSDRGR